MEALRVELQLRVGDHISSRHAAFYAVVHGAAQFSTAPSTFGTHTGQDSTRRRHDTMKRRTSVMLVRVQA